MKASFTLDNKNMTEMNGLPAEAHNREEIIDTFSVERTSEWTDAEIAAAFSGAWARTQATLNAIHIDDPAAIGAETGIDDEHRSNVF